MLHAAGETLKEASLPPDSYALPFRLCTCTKMYTPGPKFLRGAFRRVEYYIAGTLFLACTKLTLHLEGRSQSSDVSCETTFAGAFGTILTVLDISVIILGLSGVLALTKVMEPLLVPSRQDLVTLRHRLFLYMQTFIAVQTVLIFGITVPMVTAPCRSQQIETLTIAAQMLLFQIFSYKAFIPFFTWGPPHKMTNTPSKTNKKLISEFKFLVPVAEMASKFEKDANGAIEMSSRPTSR
jgi:hypothetical protein